MLSDTVKKMISPQQLVEVDFLCLGGRSAKLGGRRRGAGLNGQLGGTIVS